MYFVVNSFCLDLDLQFHSFPPGSLPTNMGAMTKLRFLFISLLLVCAGLRTDAALFGGEKRDFELASESFRLQMWARAEKGFATFIKDHPKSEKLTDALLLQAEAMFRQKKFSETVTLLSARSADAGKASDQFLYWTAEAQFQNGNHREAATTFGKLAREFSFSTRRLEAAVGEASSLMQLNEWAQVTNLLRKADGAFRMSVSESANKGSETAARGFILLGEAQFALKNYYDVESAVNRAAAGATGKLEWQRRYLLCRAYAASGRNEDASKESLALISAAEAIHQAELISTSVVFRANILEKLGQSDEAMLALKRNLTNAPAASQRAALTRITGLALANNRLDEATLSLEQYLSESNAPAADFAWLTLGEVHLKQHVTAMSLSATNDATTNHLALATNCFQQVITSFSNSDSAGKAQLNLGWCLWIEKRFAASAVAFEAATKRLPVSEDLAVARFKLADAQFTQANYSDALKNYQVVLQLATNWPAVNVTLSAPASYQALRASLELTNAVGAETAMRGILEADAAGNSADGAVLLVAQAYVDANQPAAAQRMFEEFVAKFPNSNLRPEAELLATRMREDQGDWTNALSSYEKWVTLFPTNALRPRVEFQRALALARSGEETNALRSFTNFVAQFPASDLAARAQWWVADYFYQREDYTGAEIGYKQLFNHWPKSDLAYEARMMAGRAAIGKFSYTEAIEHFSNLTSDTNCPAALRAQALFAYGGALMSSVPATTNKNDKAELLEQARSVFAVLVKENNTNELAALAWGEVGNCCLQLAATDASYYRAASNAYQSSFTIPLASEATRCQSKIGLALVLEKQSAQSTNGNQIELLREARELSLDVYQGKDVETNSFWRKKAGIEAARFSELLGDWRQAIELYRDMRRLGMLSVSVLEVKVANAEKQLSGKKL